MPVDPSQFIETIILACLETNPIIFRNVDEAEVKRARAAIIRATTLEGAVLRYPVRRSQFLGACLKFTATLPEEHLIVGYGFRYGNTTDIERIHHVVGEEGRVSVPDYIRREIPKHHFHSSDAEVIIFHNHPRTGEGPQWLYTLKALLQDLPIPSHADREQLRKHAYNSVGLVRKIFGGGQVLFFLGESGFVREFHLLPLLPFLDRLNDLKRSAGMRVAAVA